MLPTGTSQIFAAISPVLLVHDHAMGQRVGQGADLANGPAGAWLAGEREGAVARGGNLADEQMDVVDQIVDPGAPGVLVHAHAPEGGHLLGRITVQRRQIFDVAR